MTADDLAEDALLPPIPGLDALLSEGWLDASEPAQLFTRTLFYRGVDPGVVVLSWGPELVDIVAVRTAPAIDPRVGFAYVQDIARPEELVPWLEAWARKP